MTAENPRRKPRSCNPLKVEPLNLLQSELTKISIKTNKSFCHVLRCHLPAAGNTCSPWRIPAAALVFSVHGASSTPFDSDRINPGNKTLSRPPFPKARRISGL